MLGQYLLQQLNALQECGSLCDLILVSSDGTSIKVHHLLFTAFNTKHFVQAKGLHTAPPEGGYKIMPLCLTSEELIIFVTFIYGKTLVRKSKYDLLMSALHKLDMVHLIEESGGVTVGHQEPDIKQEQEAVGDTANAAEDTNTISNIIMPVTEVKTNAAEDTNTISNIIMPVTEVKTNAAEDTNTISNIIMPVTEVKTNAAEDTNTISNIIMPVTEVKTDDDDAAGGIAKMKTSTNTDEALLTGSNEVKHVSNVNEPVNLSTDALLENYIREVVNSQSTTNLTVDNVEVRPGSNQDNSQGIIENIKHEPMSPVKTVEAETLFRGGSGTVTAHHANTDTVVTLEQSVACKTEVDNDGVATSPHEIIEQIPDSVEQANILLEYSTNVHENKGSRDKLGNTVDTECNSWKSVAKVEHSVCSHDTGSLSDADNQSVSQPGEVAVITQSVVTKLHNLINANQKCEITAYDINFAIPVPRSTDNSQTHCDIPSGMKEEELNKGCPKVVTGQSTFIDNETSNKWDTVVSKTLANNLEKVNGNYSFVLEGDEREITQRQITSDEPDKTSLPVSKCISELDTISFKDNISASVPNNTAETEGATTVHCQESMTCDRNCVVNDYVNDVKEENNESTAQNNSTSSVSILNNKSEDSNQVMPNATTELIELSNAEVTDKQNMTVKPMQNLAEHSMLREKETVHVSTANSQQQQKSNDLLPVYRNIDPRPVTHHVISGESPKLASIVTSAADDNFKKPAHKLYRKLGRRRLFKKSKHLTLPKGKPKKKAALKLSALYPSITGLLNTASADIDDNGLSKRVQQNMCPPGIVKFRAVDSTVYGSLASTSPHKKQSLSTSKSSSVTVKDLLQFKRQDVGKCGHEVDDNLGQSEEEDLWQKDSPKSRPCSVPFSEILKILTAPVDLSVKNLPSKTISNTGKTKRKQAENIASGKLVPTTVPTKARQSLAGKRTKYLSKNMTAAVTTAPYSSADTTKKPVLLTTESTTSNNSSVLITSFPMMTSLLTNTPAVTQTATTYQTAPVTQTTSTKSNIATNIPGEQSLTQASLTTSPSTSYIGISTPMSELAGRKIFKSVSSSQGALSVPIKGMSLATTLVTSTNTSVWSSSCHSSTTMSSVSATVSNTAAKPPVLKVTNTCTVTKVAPSTSVITTQADEPIETNRTEAVSTTLPYLSRNPSTIAKSSVKTEPIKVRNATAGGATAKVSVTTSVITSPLFLSSPNVPFVPAATPLKTVIILPPVTSARSVAMPSPVTPGMPSPVTIGPIAGHSPVVVPPVMLYPTENLRGRKKTKSKGTVKSSPDSTSVKDPKNSDTPTPLKPLLPKQEVSMSVIPIQLFPHNGIQIHTSPAKQNNISFSVNDTFIPNIDRFSSKLFTNSGNCIVAAATCAIKDKTEITSDNRLTSNQINQLESICTDSGVVNKENKHSFGKRKARFCTAVASKRIKSRSLSLRRETITRHGPNKPAASKSIRENVTLTLCDYGHEGLNLAHEIDHDSPGDLQLSTLKKQIARHDLCKSLVNQCNSGDESDDNVPLSALVKKYEAKAESVHVETITPENVTKNETPDMATDEYINQLVKVASLLPFPTEGTSGKKVPKKIIMTNNRRKSDAMWKYKQKKLILNGNKNSDI